MADISKRAPGCDDDCEGERGERGERGKRGHRGHDGPTGPTGPTGPSFETGPTYGLGPTIPGILQPPFQDPLLTVTIYARTTGSDTPGIGNGTLAFPYRTFQRAVQDVPSIVPAGTNYIVDITGIDESLPPDYTLPCWKSAGISDFISDPIILYQASVAIFALPQLVPLAPASDAVINLVDVLSVTVDPLSGLQTVNLIVPRPSWVAGSTIKGKQVLDSAGGFFNAVVGGVGAGGSSILLTNNAPPTFPLQIVEPSAYLHGPGGVIKSGILNVLNSDSVAFNGLKIGPDDPTSYYGLFADGLGQTVCQMSELINPGIGSTTWGHDTTFINRVLRCWVHADFATFVSNIIVVQGLWDGLPGRYLQAPVYPIFSRMVFDGCNPLEVRSFVPFSPTDPGTVDHFTLASSMVVNGLGDGVVFHGTRGLFRDVNISNCAGNGITAAEGSGHLQLSNCGGTLPNGTSGAGFGVQVNDALMVRVNAATSGQALPLRGFGAGDDMKIGDLPARTWANFTGVAPIGQEYDITAVAATGATGTGSRLYQA
jgi:hypothetical protein